MVVGTAKPARGARTFFVIGLVELPLVMGAKGSRGRLRCCEGLCLDGTVWRETTLVAVDDGVRAL